MEESTVHGVDSTDHAMDSSAHGVDNTAQHRTRWFAFAKVYNKIPDFLQTFILKCRNLAQKVKEKIPHSLVYQTVYQCGRTKSEGEGQKQPFENCHAERTTK